jgi:uncharacterized repeat protein (TIGR03833 family)
VAASDFKHKPFSALRQVAAAAGKPTPPPHSAPAGKPTPALHSAPAARVPFSRVVVREEFDATEATVITRVIGVPREQLNDLGKLWRQELGVAVLLEGPELLVMAGEGERVVGLLRGAGASDVVIVRRPAPADPSQAGETGGTQRAQIRRGLRVAVVLKADQDSGALTEGVVQDVLTSAPVHPRGIKVRLESGQVGRVRRILAR